MNTNMMSMDLGKLQNFCSFLSDAIYKIGRAFDWLIYKKILKVTSGSGKNYFRQNSFLLIIILEA